MLEKQNLTKSYKLSFGKNYKFFQNKYTNCHQGKAPFFWFRKGKKKKIFILLRGKYITKQKREN